MAIQLQGVSGVVAEVTTANQLATSMVQDVRLSGENSTVADLLAGATFTGTSVSTLGVAAIQVQVFSETNLTVQVQQSPQDPGVNWDSVDSWTYLASSTGADASRTVQAVGASVRVLVTNNGGVTTTQLRVTTVLCPVAEPLPRALTQAGSLRVQTVGGTSAAPQTQEVGLAAAKGAHVIIKPTDAGALGHYHLAMTSGTLAAALAANGQVFSFRWGHATNLCVITDIRCLFTTLTPFTAATLTDFGFDAFTARSFTVSPTGGTLATLTTNSMKKRTSFATTSLTAAMISTTAALTAGTQTLDAQPFANSSGRPNLTNAAAGTEQGNPGDPPLLEFRPEPGEHPLVLAQNEGFVIRNRTVWPAAGTGTVHVRVAWTECTAY